ncbi:MAG: class II D-tagatose-bisphosphate aldolase, non-catalytic subunit [Anaerolineaceae bacterium]|nr:class II D-tagatose-bisphosphate aldolase, non-catalytic subunit [Anaerolineaceae bacterium]
MHTSWLMDIVEANRRGEKKGIYAVESQNPTVQEAYLRQALSNGSPALFEISADRLDLRGQNGRIHPDDFIGKVKRVAVKVGYPRDRLFFSVHGVSPSLCQGESIESTLRKTRAFISSIIHSGFNILEICAGIPLKEDPEGQLLPPEAITAREAEFYQAAEDAAASLPDEKKPLYVLGVHPEQGMIEDKRNRAHKKDVEIRFDQFSQTARSAGLPEIEGRLLAVRVFLGPGYDSERVIPYDLSLLEELGECAHEGKPVMLEALKTDYQPQSVLDQLVEKHFALLSVGLELTYTMREALFSMAVMENETMIGKPGVYMSNFIIELDRAMLSAPQHWQKYYTGNGFEQLIARKYSLYDRSRFFLENKDVRKMKKRLFDNLEKYPVPLTVLRQFMPRQYERVAAGELENKPNALMMDAVGYALKRYSRACGWEENPCD